MPPTEITEEIKTAETTAVLTEEQIATEQLRAQYYDLLTFVKMMIKQGNGHGYFSRPDELVKFEAMREKLAEMGTPIPPLEHERSAKFYVVFDMELTDKLLSELPAPITSSNDIKFRDFWKEKVGKDKAKFLKFMRDNKVKIDSLYSNHIQVQTKTRLGEWPDESIYKIGEEVMNEIKNSTKTNETIEVSL